MRGWALILLLLLAPAAWGQEAVAKVVEIKPAQGRLEYFRPPSKPGTRYAAFVDMDGRIRDQFLTDANTVAALEFAMGGRVGLNRDSMVTIVTERSATQGKNVKKIKLDKGGLWVKCNKLKEPFEVQTGGGVMGIKGTEFVVETVGKDTKVSLLEGEIAVADPSGQPLGTMKPGEQWLLALRSAPVKKTYENPGALREELQNSPDWKTAMEVVSLIEQFDGSSPMGYYLNAIGKLDFENDPQGAAMSLAKEAAKHQGMDLGPLTDLADKFTGKPEGPNFPTNLKPDHAKGGSTPRTPLTFAWDPIPDADGYVVMLSSTEDFKTLEWTNRSKETQVAYPGNAAPLAKGKHFWRVIPVDDENHLLEGYKGSQTFVILK